MANVSFLQLHHVLLMTVLLRLMDSFVTYFAPFPSLLGPDGVTQFLAVDLGEEIGAFNHDPSAAQSALYFLIVSTMIWVFSKTQTK
jgi:glycerol transport system permease protein